MHNKWIKRWLFLLITDGNLVLVEWSKKQVEVLKRLEEVRAVASSPALVGTCFHLTQTTELAHCENISRANGIDEEKRRDTHGITLSTLFWMFGVKFTYYISIGSSSSNNCRCEQCKKKGNHITIQTQLFDQQIGEIKEIICSIPLPSGTNSHCQKCARNNLPLIKDSISDI